ncbi:unnamed protein product, partial [Brassica rapa]
LSISTHISTLVLGISTLGNPVDCLGDVAPRGLSVQYTQDVRGCPPSHTGRPWVTSVGVRQHTQDVRGCSCVSVSVRVCVRVFSSAHTGHTWLSISTHISTLVLGISTLCHPVDCLGDFGPRGLCVKYTQDDVRGCPSAHTRRPCVSVSTHRSSVAYRVCPCVSVSTHRMSVAVHPYTYQHVGPWTQHSDLSHGLFGTHRTSACVRQHTQVIRGCPCVSVSTHMTSVADVRGCSCVSVCFRQNTLDDIRGCPSVHISARWSLESARWAIPWTVWVMLPHVGCLFCTHRTSYTQDVRGCPPAHTGRPWVMSVGVRQHTQDVRGCSCVSVCFRRPWVSASTHRTSVGVHQPTQDVRVCPSAHTGSSCACVCPCVSVSTHRTSVAVHQYTYQHVGPWNQHAGQSRELFG